MRYEDKLLLLRRAFMVINLCVWAALGVAFAKFETSLDKVMVGLSAVFVLGWGAEIKRNWRSK